MYSDVVEASSWPIRTWRPDEFAVSTEEGWLEALRASADDHLAVVVHLEAVDVAKQRVGTEVEVAEVVELVARSS